MKSVILIGPFGIGKSTVAPLLARSRNQLCCSLDEKMNGYYYEQGLTSEAEDNLGDMISLKWQPYHFYAIRRFLEDYKSEPCVMDFGGSHTLLEGSYLEDTKEIFRSYEVVLLTPSPDIAKSIDYLNKRNTKHSVRSSNPYNEWNTYLLTHSSYGLLANHIVYTIDKDPKETCQDVLKALTSNSDNH